MVAIEQGKYPLSWEQWELIAQSPVFQGVDPARLKVLLEPRADLRSFRRGEVIFSPQHFEECIGIFLKGKAVAEKAQGSVILNTFQPGSCFGVATLFCPSRRYVTTVRAKSDCQAAFFSGKDMEALFQEESRIGLNYIAFLSSRIHFLNRKIDKFTAVSAEEKLVLWLLEQLEGGNPVPVNGSFSKLAEMLDMSRSSLYRALDALEADGILQREGKSLKILDRDRLETAVSGEGV